MKFLEQVQQFVLEHGMTINEEQANVFKTSPHIVEEILLRLAGIRSAPVFTTVDEDDHTVRFSLAGLTEADYEAFARDLSLPLDQICHLDERYHVFVVTQRYACDYLLPQLTNFISNGVLTRSRLLKPYICANLIEHRIEQFLDKIRYEIFNEIKCISDVQVIFNKLTALAKEYREAVQFYHLTKDVFASLAYRPLLDILTEFRALTVTFPAIQQSPLLLASLKGMTDQLRVLLIAVTPSHYLQHKHFYSAVDAEGNAIRFFQQPLRNISAEKCDSDSEDEKQLMNRVTLSG